MVKQIDLSRPLLAGLYWIKLCNVLKSTTNLYFLDPEPEVKVSSKMKRSVDRESGFKGSDQPFRFTKRQTGEDGGRHFRFERQVSGGAKN